MTLKRSVLSRSLLIVSIVSLLFSCRKEAVDYRSFPVNSVFRGAADGQTLFLVRSEDSLQVAGYGFLYGGEAEVVPVPFVADSVGGLCFAEGVGNLPAELHIRTSAGRLQLSIPQKGGCRLIKRKVDLEPFYSLDAGSRYVMPYKQDVCDSMVSHLDVEYSRAMGYYSSQPTDTIATGKMDQVRKLIVKDLARSMARRTEIPLHMDIYEPAVDTGSARPLVVFMHGGAFLFGDKQNSLQQAITESLVRKGYVVASVNYRLGISFVGLSSVERTIYRGVKDTRSAMRYLIEHAEEYKIDVNQIYLSGSSAGAIIALTTTFMDGDEVFESVEKRIDRDDLGAFRPSPNSDDEKFKVAGVVSLWGGLIDLEVVNERDGAIPVLLFHGTADNIVPCESGLPFQDEFDSKLYDKISASWRLYGSSAICRHMQEQNMPVEFVPFPDCGHEPQENEDGTLNENMDRILEGTGDFLYAQVSDYYAPCTIEVLDGALATRYALEGGCRPLDWLVDGGIVVDKSDKEMRVVWLSGTDRRAVRAVVSDGEGVCFEKSLEVSAPIR